MLRSYLLRWPSLTGAPTMEVAMHTLTRDEAKRAGYTGYAEHLTTVPCPRLTDKRIYCATCQGALAQLAAKLAK
jgi:hypothetical protein